MQKISKGKKTGSDESAKAGSSESVQAVLEETSRPRRARTAPVRLVPGENPVEKAAKVVEEGFTGVVDVFHGVSTFPKVSVDQVTLSKLFDQIHGLFGTVTGTRRGINYTAGSGSGTSGSVTADGVAKMVMVMVKILCACLDVPESAEVFRDFEIWDLGSGDGRLLLMMALLGRFSACFGIDLPGNRVNILRIFNAVLLQEKLPELSYSTVEMSFGDLAVERPLEEYFGRSLNGGARKIVMSFCESIPCKPKMLGDVLEMKDPESGELTVRLIVLVDKSPALRGFEEILGCKFDCVERLPVRMIGSEQTNAYFFAPRTEAIDLTASPARTVRSETSLQPSPNLDGGGSDGGGSDGSGASSQASPNFDGGAGRGSDGSEDDVDEPSDGGSERSETFDFGRGEGKSDSCDEQGSDEAGAADVDSDEAGAADVDSDEAGAADVDSDEAGAADVDSDEGGADQADGSLADDARLYAEDLRQKREEVLRILKESIPGFEMDEVVEENTVYFEFQCHLVKRGAQTHFNVAALYSGERQTGFNSPTWRNAFLCSKFQKGGDNNFFPKPLYPFNGKECFGVINPRDEVYIHLMATEPLDVFMPDFMKSVQTEFLQCGRINAKYRYFTRDLLNALCFLHFKGVTHGKICEGSLRKREQTHRLVLTSLEFAKDTKTFEYENIVNDLVHAKTRKMVYPVVTKKPDDNILHDISGVVLGYKPPSKMSGVEHDLYSVGLLLLIVLVEDVVRPPPEDVFAAKAKNMVVRTKLQNDLHAIYDSKGEIGLGDLLGLVVDFCQHCAHSDERNKVIAIAESIIEEGGEAFTYMEENLIYEVRAENLVNLLKLVCTLLNGKTTAKDALCSPFAVRYIADDMELERKLVLEGLPVYKHEDVKLKKGVQSKPTVMFDIPLIWMNVFAGVDTEPGAHVSGYGAEKGPRTQRNFPPSIKTQSLHTIPLPHGEEIYGAPDNPENLDGVSFSEMVFTGSSGSFIASSREYPAISAPGNVGLDSSNKVQTVHVGSKACSLVSMFAEVFIKRGTVLNWNYNWAAMCGGIAFTDEGIAESASSYRRNPGEFEYIKKQMDKHHKAFLEQGYKDFA